MSKSIKTALVVLAASAATATPALASAPLPPSLPFGEVSVLGLVAGTVIAGVWIARRKR